MRLLRVLTDSLASVRAGDADVFLGPAVPRYSFFRSRFASAMATSAFLVCPGDQCRPPGGSTDSGTPRIPAWATKRPVVFRPPRSTGVTTATYAMKTKKGRSRNISGMLSSSRSNQLTWSGLVLVPTRKPARHSVNKHKRTPAKCTSLARNKTGIDALTTALRLMFGTGENMAIKLTFKTVAVAFMEPWRRAVVTHKTSSGV
eukprot:938159-Prymnesium_polylepis.1